MSASPLTFAQDYEKSRIVLFGAPFDGTVCYRPGARFGPNAIRSEFYGLEPYSPYQDKDIRDVLVFDCGDLDLPFGNSGRVLEMIEDFVDKLALEGRLPFMIGGEHLVTLGAIRALHKKYDDLAVIQLDAHADLMEAYMGEELSHAAVMRRVWELVGDKRIYQFGIRSGKKFEFEFAQKHNHIQKFNFDGLKAVVDALGDMPVYLTIDLDVLDPSILPGTGTPEAGGVSFGELLEAILGFSRLNIVGCDMVELSPIYDDSGVSTAVACKVLREMLLMLSGEGKPPPYGEVANGLKF